jgi:hypothetical protein
MNDGCIKIALSQDGGLLKLKKIVAASEAGFGSSAKLPCAGYGSSSAKRVHFGLGSDSQI